jgi:acetyltransferase-like isoleucine patch superfamily enzyme
LQTGDRYTGKAIIIEDGVWIGTHVVILPSVTIGEGAIIAAHSLVNKDIPPYEIWGGVPSNLLNVALNRSLEVKSLK